MYNFLKWIISQTKMYEICQMFKWQEAIEGNYFTCITFDKETNEIILNEESIMKIIQMVNPCQRKRKIRLVSRNEWDEKWKKQ